MAANLAMVKERVQSILAGNFSAELHKNGYTLRHQSARMFVEVHERGEGDSAFTVINLTCPVLFKVKPTPELFKHIALHADDYLFGHLSATEDEDGINIYFTHVLLGDYLDEEELKRAVGGVLGMGNDLDDELQAQFGGDRFHED